MLALSSSKRVLPGFGLSLGSSLFYTCLILLLPLTALVMQLAQMSLAQYWEVISNPQVVAAYKVTLLAAGVASLFNAVFGMLMAWILTRYRFPGRSLLDGLIDLPFALPTAVAGLTLAGLFSTTGWYGQWLAHFDIKVTFTWLGIAVAMAFTSLPFVVRTVQPVLEELGRNTKRRPRRWAPRAGRASAAWCCPRWRRHCWPAPPFPLPAAWASLAR